MREPLTPPSLNPTSVNPTSVNPTWRERLSQALRPDFARTAAARRLAAAFLVVLAAVSALWPDPGNTYVHVAVAAADISPGHVLTAGDVRLEKRLAATLPDGALGSLESLLGSTLAGAARRGEMLTDARVLGPRLAGLSAGPNARFVPLRLSDPAVLDVIRPGDVVDVLGAPGDDSGARPRLLAAAAVVVLVPAADRRTGGDPDRVVLVALAAPAATAVAGAGLTQALTLTIH